ncbi:TPA_asm: G [Scutellaria alphacytorhabdovirus 1]|nr:TPA_asm: G [Scutellaria alphacytorhabdovirus 1]
MPAHYFLILLFSSLIWTNMLTPVMCDLTTYHQISPVAACDLKKTINAYAELDECIHRCSQAIGYKGAASIMLMQDYSSDPGPSVTVCQKIRIKQSFEETWTFSTIEHNPEITLETPSKAECDDYIRNNCSNLNCMSYTPNRLTPEYAYASVVRKEETYIVVAAHHSSMKEVDGKLLITPMFSTTSFDLSLGYGEDEKGKYYWDTKMQLSRCPLSDGLRMGCDVVDLGHGDMYICGGGRLAIDKANSITMSGACKDVKVSPGGIVYKVVPKNENDDHYKNQKIGMTGFTALAGDAERVRVLSQHAIYHIDADLCSLQCEVSGIELRSARKSQTLLRSGDEYMLVDPKGHGFPCSVVTHCKLNRPIRVCGSPDRISVHCNGKDYYWNPSLNYVTNYDYCSAPHREESISIHIGNKRYNIGEDLHIEVPENDTYTHKSRSFLLSHESMFKITDLDAIRAAWKQEKSKPNHNAGLASASITTEQSSIGFQSVLEYVGSIMKSISRVLSHAEAAIIAFILSGISLYVGYKFWSNSNKRPKKRPASEESMTWI